VRLACSLLVVLSRSLLSTVACTAAEGQQHTKQYKPAPEDRTNARFASLAGMSRIGLDLHARRAGLATVAAVVLEGG
jgi:hypothetical protein